MNQFEEKYCAKCGSKIIGQMIDIGQCKCTPVPLSKVTQLFISKTHFDCLCKKCLTQINTDVVAAQSSQFPSRKKMLIEGLHYYKEGSKWIFTEWYHFLRGFCCGNGCRHCVYGHKYYHTRKIH